MTLIGKLLAFLNLVVGVGLVTWAVSVYAQRPGWFDPIPEGVDRGHSPENFAMLKAETDALAKTANLASGSWGQALKALEQVEDTRDKRRKAYADRLAWAHKGNKDKGGAAFFAPVYEKDAGGKDTSTLDVAALGPPVKGADDRPLRGVDALLTNLAADGKEIERLALQVAQHRKEYADLSEQVVVADSQLLKMITIREAVLAERFYLDTFEVNVYETRETVLRRKRQLSLRLAELGAK